jgi:hypothetical protein
MAIGGTLLCLVMPAMAQTPNTVVITTPRDTLFVHDTITGVTVTAYDALGKRASSALIGWIETPFGYADAIGVGQRGKQAIIVGLNVGSATLAAVWLRPDGSRVTSYLPVRVVNKTKPCFFAALDHDGSYQLTDTTGLRTCADSTVGGIWFVHDTTKTKPDTIVPLLLRRQARRPTRIVAGNVAPLLLDTMNLAVMDSSLMRQVGQCRILAMQRHVPVPLAPIPPAAQQFTNERQVEVIMLGQQLAVCQAALIHRGIPLRPLPVHKQVVQHATQ